jgi:isopenicillin N synthase-like dioxygenase
MRMAPRHHNPSSKNIYHGYFPFLDSDSSHKEFIDIGRPFSDISEWESKGCSLYEPHPWVEGENEEIRETLDEHYKVMHRLAMRLIRCMALGLGKKADYFDPWFEKECSSTLRGIHYMPRSEESLSKLTPE